MDAFQFGVAGDLSWSFAHKHFLCDLKADPTQATADLALSSIASPATLVVVDEANRILSYFVEDITLRVALQPGAYQYDLVMVDDTTGERDLLMIGTITVTQGVTIED
jgi:hypothetical protein